MSLFVKYQPFYFSLYVLTHSGTVLEICMIFVVIPGWLVARSARGHYLKQCHLFQWEYNHTFHDNTFENVCHNFDVCSGLIVWAQFPHRQRYQSYYHHFQPGWQAWCWVCAFIHNNVDERFQTVQQGDEAASRRLAIEQADQLKAQGDIIIAIGVTDYIDEDFLRTISSPPHQVSC